MTTFQSILLGIVQGLTEFIPVSSSAHLVLVPFFLGWHIPPDLSFIFDVLVQFATLGAVLVYYAKDLWHILLSFIKVLQSRKVENNPDFNLLIALIIATLPIVILGIPIKKYVADSFNNIPFVATALLITALFLYLAEKIAAHKTQHDSVTRWDALVVGLFQVLAAFPGISRSGATISGGMLRKLNRSSATRFAFLLSIPALTGAGLVSLLDLLKMPNWVQTLGVIFPGFVVAFGVGLISIHWLVKHV
ncbi:MAG: undecaprenyl-diphosphate phosphatase, partial [Anaerolineales bacterium]